MTNEHEIITKSNKNLLEKSSTISQQNVTASNNTALSFTQNEYNYIKKRANYYYFNGRFEDAIKLYDSLITNYIKYNLKNDEVSKLYSNSCMCWYFLKEYKKCKTSCLNSIEYDANNIKGLGGTSFLGKF